MRSKERRLEVRDCLKTFSSPEAALLLVSTKNHNLWPDSIFVFSGNQIWQIWWQVPFSSPEAALLLVSTKNRDLWPGPTPEVRDSRTSCHSAYAQRQVWQIWLVLVSIYCVYKAIQNRNVVGPGQRSRIFGADPKEGGLWGRELPNDVKILINFTLQPAMWFIENFKSHLVCFNSLYSWTMPCVKWIHSTWYDVKTADV